MCFPLEKTLSLFASHSYISFFLGLQCYFQIGQCEEPELFSLGQLNKIEIVK